ncbi:TFIIB-type zinc ribbon-containing protein [Natronobacterium lacisalsi]|uniref:TFIIB-type zinc ribbon-containing protein n=1 Tax=Natronobacterium lacisalsi TaxID=229731 RepID=UPI001EE6FDD0|nr:TFIIB-type zinc ribbon-containing protein [Halobiforma lacisalsi]
MATDQTVRSRSTRDASQQSQSTLSCPECSSKLVTANREAYCRECGLIADENQFDHGPEWFASDKDSSRRRTGAPLTAGRHDRGSLNSEPGEQLLEQLEDVMDADSARWSAVGSKFPILYDEWERRY